MQNNLGALSNELAREKSSDEKWAPAVGELWFAVPVGFYSFEGYSLGCAAAP